MLGGFAMQWTKSSRPASGAEHQFSHLWDMEHHTHNGAAPSHGFKVGVATLAVTAVYEELRAVRWSSSISSAASRSGRSSRKPRPMCASASRERIFWRRRWWRRARSTCRARCCGHNWGNSGGVADVAEAIGGELVPYAELKQRLVLVGAPTEPEQIGIACTRLRDAFRRAYHIRRRFTVLDLAMRAGVLDDCVAQMFGPGGAWPS